MFADEVTPDEVWDCIAHLPRESATMSALADDPHFPPGDAPEHPPMSEYSPEVEAIGRVHDMTAALFVLVASLFAKGGAPKVAPFPRPLPAGQREAQKRAMSERWQRHRVLVARLIPGKGEDHG
jgi:hypothetical protein